MHMAFELNNRTKILAGIAALVLAGAGAGWFFFLQDEAPPPRAAAPAKPAAKPAAEAAKGAPDAAKSAAVPAADAAKAVAVAPASKPGAKPIPTNPDQLIAEVIEISGMKTYFQSFAREAMLKSSTSVQNEQQVADPADFAAATGVVDRVFEPGALAAEVAAKLKGNIDAERMARFLELLRQPVALKMTSPPMRNVTPEAMKEYADSLRKGPPAAARVKLIQSLDELTHTSEVGTDMTSAMARDMVDGMLDAMKKAGKSVQREARQAVGTQVNAIRVQALAHIRAVMYVMYRNATDEELSEYVKLLDTDTGRWGLELLAEAIRPALVNRGSTLGRENVQFAMAKLGAAAKAPAAAQPVVKIEEDKPVEKPAAASAAAPAEQPGYQRPANIREVYSRYNDVISATVMRDRAAVKELLDDGKSPNARQQDGVTPLMVAASNGDADIAAMLLAKGADPTLRAQGGRTALSMANARGAAGAQMVQLLQSSGARD
jgi:hypothetical protein